MTVTVPLWLTIGAGLGGWHVSALWRTARGGDKLPGVAGVLRLPIVAAALVGAALAGDLLAASAGWIIGFVAAVVAVLARGDNSR